MPIANNMHVTEKCHYQNNRDIVKKNIQLTNTSQIDIFLLPHKKWIIDAEGLNHVELFQILLHMREINNTFAESWDDAVSENTTPDIQWRVLDKTIIFHYQIRGHSNWGYFPLLICWAERHSNLNEFHMPNRGKCWALIKSVQYMIAITFEWCFDFVFSHINNTGLIQRTFNYSEMSWA